MLETLDPPWCLLRDCVITFTSSSRRLAHSCPTPRWCRARRSPFEPGFLASIGIQTPDSRSKRAVIGARCFEDPVAARQLHAQPHLGPGALVTALRLCTPGACSWGWDARFQAAAKRHVQLVAHRRRSALTLDSIRCRARGGKNFRRNHLVWVLRRAVDLGLRWRIGLPLEPDDGQDLASPGFAQNGNPRGTAAEVGFGARPATRRSCASRSTLATDLRGSCHG